MDRVHASLKMAMSIRVNYDTAFSTAKVLLNGLMALSTRENSVKTKSQAKVTTPGQMEALIRDKF